MVEGCVVAGLVEVPGTVVPGLTGFVPVAGTVLPELGVTAPGNVPGCVMLPGTVPPGVTAPGAVDCGLVTLPGTVVVVPGKLVDGCVVAGAVCGYVPIGDVVGCVVAGSTDPGWVVLTLPGVVDCVLPAGAAGLVVLPGAVEVGIT